MVLVTELYGKVYESSATRSIFSQADCEHLSFPQLIIVVFQTYLYIRMLFFAFSVSGIRYGGDSL
jgi:hypothetical protein